MNPPVLTVGIPLHNGAEYLEDCLECLQNQTLKNIKVVIFENASTDNSYEIAKKFSKKDSRFSIEPSDTLLTARENFIRAILSIHNTADYFCLRAHDDTTNREYLEKLVAELEKDKDLEFAVPAVSYFKDGAFINEAKLNYDVLKASHFSVWSLKKKDLYFPGSWYYGIYKGKKAADILLNTFQEFQSAWGGDKLAILRFLIRGKTVHAHGAEFYCTLTESSVATHRRKKSYDKLSDRILFHSILYSSKPKMPLLNRIMLWWTLFRASKHHTGYSFKEIVVSIFSKP